MADSESWTISEVSTYILWAGMQKRKEILLFGGNKSKNHTG